MLSRFITKEQLNLAPELLSTEASKAYIEFLTILVIKSKSAREILSETNLTVTDLIKGFNGRVEPPSLGRFSGMMILLLA